MAHLFLQGTTVLGAQVIPATTYTVAQYTAAIEVDNTYINTGLAPYSTLTILKQCVYMMTAGLAWTAAADAGVSNIYIQVKRSGSSTWIPIAGTTTTRAASEGVALHKTANVAAIARLFEEDQLRVVYYCTAATTIPYGDTLSTARHRPYFSIHTNIP
jgi:hypothetical protein